MEMNQKRITIDKKDGIYLLLFAISLINGVVCTAFFVLLLLYSINEIEKGLKSLILISTREILSPVIASSTGNAVIKMGVILLISILMKYDCFYSKHRIFLNCRLCKANLTNLN